MLCSNCNKKIAEIYCDTCKDIFCDVMCLEIHLKKLDGQLRAIDFIKNLPKPNILHKVKVD